MTEMKITLLGRRNHSAKFVDALSGIDQRPSYQEFAFARDFHVPTPAGGLVVTRFTQDHKAPSREDTHCIFSATFAE